MRTILHWKSQRMSFFLIPLRLDDCVVPRKLKSLQWVDYFSEEKSEAYSNLLAALKLRYEEKAYVDLVNSAHEKNDSQVPPENKKLTRILATAKSIREQKEKEDREKAELETVNGEEQKPIASPVPNQNKRENEQKLLGRTVEEAQYLKDILESIADRPVVVGPVEKEAHLPSEHKFAAQPTPGLIAGIQLRKRKFPVWVMPLIVLVLISLSIWGVYQLRAVFSAFTSTPSPTEQPVTEMLTSIKLPTQTPTLALTETPAELSLGIGSTMIGKDGMVLVYVPAGDFLMGSTDADSYASDNEKPQHTVYLDAFWIDQTEVTNFMYAKCVSDGACQEPKYKGSYTRSEYYGNTDFDNYPVVSVDWDMAKTYCLWVGRSLPTEAQWEKAARGVDGRTYPWGENQNNTFANFNHPKGDTAPVRMYQNDQSIYGAYDMAGNVLEWVADWYSDTYYRQSLLVNPLGPDLGRLRVLRGGSWLSFSYDVRSAKRGIFGGTTSYFSVGFRCARSE